MKILNVMGHLFGDGRDSFSDGFRAVAMVMLFGVAAFPAQGQGASGMAVSAAPAGDVGAPTAESPSTRDYRLRPGDMIRIIVFQEDDLTTETRIPDSGAIMFPLLGPVRVEGKSISEAQEDIRSELAKKYIRNPSVSVSVLDYAKLWVTVLGEVQKPGNVEIPPDGGLDLLAVVALAGGFTPDANKARITVRRVVDGQDQILVVNAKDLSGNAKVKPFVVEAGDSISVPERMF